MDQAAHEAAARAMEQARQNAMEHIKFFEKKKITVHKPGETEYERAVATSNLLYRFTRPDCVVQPEQDYHVAVIVKRAKAHKIPIRIKNGGHSYAGFSMTNEGILLDLVKMNDVELDMKSKTVTLQGGALWGHAYKTLVNDHHDGYIINGGRCPTVGVSGFTLGGGLGPFTRSFGMGSDTLQEATIVTADGELVTVKESGNKTRKEDRLFWALCGAGGGNFGVLVEMKMKVQQLRGEKVVAGRFTWSPTPPTTDPKDPTKPADVTEPAAPTNPEDPASSAALPTPPYMVTFMETMNTFYTADWPKEMTIDSSWLCDLSQTRTEPAVRFLVYYDGKEDEFDSLMDKHLGTGELSTQLKRRTIEEKSTRFLHETLVTQWSEETIKAFPSNAAYRIYTSFVFKNKKEKIEQITKIIRDELNDFRKRFTGEQGLLQVTWIHSGGKANEWPRDASAFRWRGCAYNAYIMIEWQEKWLERDMRDFLENFNKKLRIFSMGGRAAFINFPDEALLPEAHEQAYYGNNHKELQQIKEVWDKDELFKWTQGVKLPPQELMVETSAMMAADNSVPGPASLMSLPIMKPPGDVDETTTVAAEEEFATGRQLTDKIAADEWDLFRRPTTNQFVGGIQGLSDLGF